MFLFTAVKIVLFLKIGGPRGPEGKTGGDGPPGSIGIIGNIGYAGPKGKVGEPGLGPDGELGDSGPAGRVGKTKGNKGFRGNYNNHILCCVIKKKLSAIYVLNLIVEYGYVPYVCMICSLTQFSTCIKSIKFPLCYFYCS